MKKIFKILILTSFIIISSLSVSVLPALANQDPGSAQQSSGKTRYNSDESCPDFLGLTSWDCGLTGKTDSEGQLKKHIWLIASNIATDAAVVAAYLVLGYIIYGGYLYTFSGGDPGKAANGKKTLSQAFIGLAIVLSANLIMGTIRITLASNSGGDITNCIAGEGACVSANALVQNLVDWFIAIAGVVSAIFLVYGGISYITSSGDPNKTTKAKQMITYSLIGLAIVALSVVISAFVSNMINEANTNAAYLNKSIISKEVNETKIN